MTESPTTSRVDALAERFWERYLELNPTTATVYGDERYAERLEDPSPAGRARLRELFESTLGEVEAIPVGGLTVEERITRDVLAVVCRLAIEEDDQGLHRLRTVDQISGPQTLLPQIAQFQPADTPERLERFVARLRAYPAYIDAHIGILDEGLATGLTAPRIGVERTIEQLERLIAYPADESPIVVAARVADPAARARIRDAVEEAVLPADRAFLEALRGRYLAASRVEPGLWSAPDGDALYRTQIRAWTTLDLDPLEVHEAGRALLETIGAEQRAIARAAGFGDDVRAYREHLATDPTNIPRSADELLARAREDIDRALAVAPRFFGRLPRSGIEVRAVEEFKERESPFAYYFPPTTDGSRPGVYYANTYDLPSRLFTKLATTTYHEAVPGHHFQIALEMENPDLNVFRRLGARMVGGAYVEGWGLYAERLADEMGLFRTEGERFGMLDAQAWRAARLVVDTGIHALRWSREEGIAFLHEVGLSETDARIETERYIVWPGQALTYMIGMREIVRLRGELEARDGAAFDLRRFHDEVLGHGSLPLATLASQLPGWVAAPA
ncbi:MAG TPA: DUF885 domain-containing protein [Candidatus Limnocylindrales bacterium]|nr:DUF885 domain-containing protein [Candidatus Limnocylindrales bacterium]